MEPDGARAGEPGRRAGGVGGRSGGRVLRLSGRKTTGWATRRGGGGGATSRPISSSPSPLIPPVAPYYTPTPN